MKNQYLKELLEQMDDIVPDTADFHVDAVEGQPAIVTVKSGGIHRIYKQADNMQSLELLVEFDM